MADKAGLLRKALIVFLFWTGVALLICSITFFTQLQEDSAIKLVPFRIFLFEMICISPWMLSTPLIIWAARWYSFSSDAIVKCLGVHAVVALLVFSAHSLLQSVAVSWFYNESFTLSYLMRDFLGFLDMRLLLYTGLLLAVYAVDFQKKAREVKLREVQLKRELNMARFQALLNQIQPDFLLETIEMIHDTIDAELAGAEQQLTQMSDLLRIMLNGINRNEVAIQEDLKSYRLYCNLLQARIGQNFDINTDINEDCYSALIPPFLQLIPVFEGIVQAMEGRNGRITCICYKAEKADQSVLLQLIIEGRNLPRKEMPKLIGKTNIVEISKQLDKTYGQANHFKTEISEGIIKIGLILPFRESRKNLKTDNLVSAGTQTIKSS